MFLVEEGLEESTPSSAGRSTEFGMRGGPSVGDGLPTPVPLLDATALLLTSFHA